MLTLKTDFFPSETAWTFKMTDPGPGCVDSTTESDAYTQPSKDHVETISTQICAGQAYSFEITDSWGDGICCDWGRGSYVVELDGKEVAAGGRFGRTEKTSFVAPSSTTCEAAGCDTGCLMLNDAGQATCEAMMGRPACDAAAGFTRFCGYAAPRHLVVQSPEELGNTVLLHFSAESVPESVKFRVEARSGSASWVGAIGYFYGTFMVLYLT